MIQHLAIIMDGNGRWAQQRGKPRLAGHEAGAETVRAVLGYCRKANIRYLTLYAFSTENWARPKAEVAGLMTLLDRFLSKHLAELIKDEIRLRVIGQRSDLPDGLQKSLAAAEEKTSAFHEHELILALSYSGRNELVRAVRRLAADVKAGARDPAAIDEAVLKSYLDTAELPDPDLIIRTSGELRLSNFLLWQCAYSELYVTPVLWPDFRETDFNAALAAYAKRDRRFGLVHPNEEIAK